MSWILWILFAIILICFVFTFIYWWFWSKSSLTKQRKKRQNAEIIPPKPVVKKPSPPPPPPLGKRQEKPKVEVIENKNFAERVERESALKIVGIVDPIGQWTKMVIGQKLQFLLAQIGMQNKNSSGYWTNLIRAQDRHNKEKGRGR
jgi:hypothetical protein